MLTGSQTARSLWRETLSVARGNGEVGHVCLGWARMAFPEPMLPTSICMAEEVPGCPAPCPALRGNWLTLLVRAPQ